MTNLQENKLSPQMFYHFQPLVTMMHRFNIKDYIDDFKTLQLSLVFSFQEPKKLDNLIRESIERHALLVKTK